MTVLLFDMLLIWRSWQMAGRQRGRVRGALTQSQEPGVWKPLCRSLRAWQPPPPPPCPLCTLRGQGESTPSPAPAPHCKSGILFKSMKPIWFPLRRLHFLKCRPPPHTHTLQSRFLPCDPIFSQWCSVLWLVVLCA